MRFSGGLQLAAVGEQSYPAVAVADQVRSGSCGTGAIIARDGVEIDVDRFPIDERGGYAATMQSADVVGPGSGHPSGAG